MIGQLNSLLPPIRPHTSLFYRQTFHPITDIFSLLLSILVPPPRATERERERGARAQPASPPPPFTRPLSTPLLPAHACTSSLWCWLDADRRISSSFLSLCSFPPFLSSLYPPLFPFPPPPLFSNIWSFSSSASSLLPLPHHQDVALSGSAPLWILCFDPRWACLHVSLCLSFTLFSGNRIAAAF